MSWKGFTKAVTRFPTQVARKTGHSTASTDPVYDELEAKFKRTDSLANKLSDDAIRFKDSLSAMLAHQERFGATLLDVYRPITALSAPTLSSGGTAVTGKEAEAGPMYDEKAAQALSSRYPEENHQAALTRVEAFAHSTREVHEQLYPELEIIERQIITPLKEYLMLIANVRRLMEKRARKLVDYDRHSESVKKLQAKQDRNLTDEKKLGSMESHLDESTRDFTNLDLTLKQQIPVFLGMAVAFIDPCFRTLYESERKVVEILHRSFSELGNKHFDMSVSAKDGFEAKHDEMLELLATLTLVKRPYKKSNGEVAGEVYEEDEKLRPTMDAKQGGPSGIPPPPPSRPDAVDQLPAYEAPNGPVFPVTDEYAKRPMEPTSAPINLPSSAVPLPTMGGSSTAFPHPVAPAAPAPASSSVSYVLALYDFESVQPGDLSFKKDDKIQVLLRSPDVNDWWTGRIGARTGQFPGNYVADM
ncbi:hypothetical protein PhCBS80983_g00471 [Powellomyces hirtus]|uniref:SH3 domain-containing protein n=1 Tax=Powellomyces hirtus TaxID=109895 RepID=A0A507EF96_9FUNG|nr:hypothetical protein PhCBS80983_g00471 [Powellomyces hirtus]